MIDYDTVSSNLRMADFVLQSLVSDLSREDLLVRPVPGANHIAWQLGHLISAECYLIGLVAPETGTAVPNDWRDKYRDDTAKSDDPSDFEPPSRYLELYLAQRDETLKAFKTLSPAQLNEPGPEILRRVVNTVGELFLFQAHHELMHAGQFTCIRRKLGKPILF